MVLNDAAINLNRIESFSSFLNILCNEIAKMS